MAKAKKEVISNIQEIRDSIADLLSKSGDVASNTMTEASQVLQDFMELLYHDKY